MIRPLMNWVYQNPVGVTTSIQMAMAKQADINYGFRNAYRVKSVEKERKFDYLFRDFYMLWIIACWMETVFRLGDRLFVDPLFTKRMQLQKLPELYKDNPNAKAYNEIPEWLRRRFFGSLVKGDSHSQIPRLMATWDKARNIPKDEQAAAEVLTKHLQKILTFKDYLQDFQKAGNISAADSKVVASQLDAIEQAVIKTRNQASPDKAINELTYRMLHNAADEKTYAPLTLDEVEQVAKTLLKKGQDISEKGWKTAINLLKEGIESKVIAKDLAGIQKFAMFPKLGMAVLGMLTFHGITASYIDVTYVQPWQAKKIKERGTVEDLIPPAYWAMIPGVGVIGALMAPAVTKHFPKVLRGYTRSWAIAAVAGLTTYTAIAWAVIKKRVSQPPDPKYLKNEGVNAKQGASAGLTNAFQSPNFANAFAGKPITHHPNLFQQFERQK